MWLIIAGVRLLLLTAPILSSDVFWISFSKYLKLFNDGQTVLDIKNKKYTLDKIYICRCGILNLYIHFYLQLRRI